MMKAPKYHVERVRAFEDAYGIECCECPGCREYIPNVGPAARKDDIVACPNEKCRLTFRLIRT